jgi:hypothetical protein
MKKGHIFVQCASYRDPDLKQTVKSALENAIWPDNITFGICWQGPMKELKRDLYYKGMPQCRTVLIEMNAAKGIGYARHKAQMMYEGEEFILQIDSHMLFMPNWDRMCIRMLNRCPSNRPLLTAYLTDHAIKEDPGCYRLGINEFDENQNVVVTGMNIIKRNKPQPGILASGHFVFADAKLFEEVPIDPEMQFLYEETLIAPRAWTSGWDIFYPHKAPMQHKWNRAYRKLNWNDQDTTSPEEHCKMLYHQIVGIQPGYNGKYGMGNARSLEAYEQFTGINFKNQTFTKRAKKGFPAKF